MGWLQLWVTVTVNHVSSFDDPVLFGLRGFTFDLTLFKVYVLASFLVGDTVS
jgi:hypothetical protein